MKKEIKNVLVCGLGAIGSIYAVKFLKNAYVNLKVLVDKDRLQSYKNNPLIFNNVEYNFDYITSIESGFKADLVVLATKNNSFGIVIDQLQNFVDENTIFLSLLNGLQSEDLLVDKFGQKNVLYSYYIGHTSTRQGRSIVHDGVYTTVFGEKNNEMFSDNVIAVKILFDKVGINYDVPIDMDYARWWKFVLNVGYNQASVLLNASYLYFQSCKKVNDFAINLMQEAVLIAKAEGVNNTEKIIPEVLEVIKTMLPEARTSMLQDVDASRVTEVDAFAGYISKMGKKYGINTPYNDICYEIISAVDEKNSM